MVSIQAGDMIGEVALAIEMGADAVDIALARRPPLWDERDALVDGGVQGEPDWSLVGQPAPDFEEEQRVNGQLSEAAISIAAGRSCVHARPKTILHPKVSPLRGCERSYGLGLRCFEAPNPWPTWLHAVEFPIPFPALFLASRRLLKKSAFGRKSWGRLLNYVWDWFGVATPAIKTKNTEALRWLNYWSHCHRNVRISVCSRKYETLTTKP